MRALKGIGAIIGCVATFAAGAGEMDERRAERAQRDLQRAREQLQECLDEGMMQLEKQIAEGWVELQEAEARGDDLAIISLATRLYELHMAENESGQQAGSRSRGVLADCFGPDNAELLLPHIAIRAAFRTGELGWRAKARIINEQLPHVNWDHQLGERLIDVLWEAKRYSDAEKMLEQIIAYPELAERERKHYKVLLADKQIELEHERFKQHVIASFAGDKQPTPKEVSESYDYFRLDQILDRMRENVKEDPAYFALKHRRFLDMFGMSSPGHIRPYYQDVLNIVKNAPEEKTTAEQRREITSTINKYLDQMPKEPEIYY